MTNSSVFSPTFPPLLALVVLSGCSLGAAGDENEPSGSSGGTGSIESEGNSTGGGGNIFGTGGLPPTGLGSGGLSGTGGVAATGGLSATGGVSSGGSASGGSDGTGGESTTPGSDGCGKSASGSTGSWQSGGTADGRPYDTWLPNNYDPARSYPVILLLHGCTSGTNNVPMEGQTGSDAILIRGTGSAASTCWNADANGPDMDFVDAMIVDVKDRFCVNPGQLFAVGYSSGSWLASRLSCNRADVFRGIATVTGGEPGGISGCSGPVARMFIHDQNDNDNKIEWNTPSRDRMIETNGCTSTSTPVDPSPCAEYQGCDPGYPVVWCQTSGQGHSRQDGLAAPAFWNFFQDLMAE